MVIEHLPAELLQDVLTVEPCVAIDLAQLSMNAIGTMFCVFENFITDRKSQFTGAGIRASIFNRCNYATVRSPEVPLVHASCYVITCKVHAVASRNKWFGNCGKNEKLTLWTHLVLDLGTVHKIMIFMK